MTHLHTYYLDDHHDEGGFGGSLEKLAALFAAHAADAPAQEPRADQWHRASLITHAYVACRLRDDGGYDIPAELPGRPVAVAFCDGGGWTADDMLMETDSLSEQLGTIGGNPVEHLACEVSSISGTIIYHSATQTCEWLPEAGSTTPAGANLSWLKAALLMEAHRVENWEDGNPGPFAANLRATVAGIDRLSADLDEAQAEVERLREALALMVALEDWQRTTGGCTPEHLVGAADRARAVLGKSR